MKIGSPLACRCPKCRSDCLTIAEEFHAYDLLTVERGLLTYRCIDSLPYPTGKYFGECQACSHKWKFRRSPINEAV